MKFVVSIDLNKNQLLNAVIQPLATAPATGVAGQIYYNTADKALYQHDGTSWKKVGVVYNQASATGKTVTGLGTDGTVTTTNVIDLTLNGYTPVEGGYVADGDTIKQAITALDTAVKNAVAGGGEVNQNAWSNIIVPVQSTNNTTEVVGQGEQATIIATAKTDTFTVASGDEWVHVNADTATKKITIGHKFSGVAAQEYGDGLNVPKITVDATGHITSVTEAEIVGAEFLENVTSDIQAQLNAKIPATEKGTKNGVATLDANGLVPSSQLPSYVDDVVDAYIVGATPLAADWLSATDGGTALTPETGKIYIIVGGGDAKYLNQQYRWSGTTYVLCNPSDVNSVNGKTGIVTLTQDDIGDGTTYVQYSKTDKEKLAGIDEGATKNTITLNGTATKNPSFYAPIEAGTADQILVSNGAGAPVWKTPDVGIQKKSVQNGELTAVGGAFTWAIANTIQDVTVQIYEVATGAMIMADVTVSATQVTITIVDSTGAGTLAANTYKAVIIG